MKKIKVSIISWLKKNWLISLLAIPLASILYYNKTPNNDTWFILSIGKYTMNKGLPTIDPFTFHEGLELVMQQWLTAYIFSFLYYTFSKHALILFIYIITIALMSIFYKLLFTVSENKKLSLILTTIAFTINYEYIVLRPQVFTYLILLTEILILEIYIKKNNPIYLFLLPFLSLLLINFHASMWYFQFIFILPFLFNNIKILKISPLNKYKIKPILISTIFMLLIGFINPYGYKALTYIFNSYGLKEINIYINEMQPITFNIKKSLIIIYSLLYLFLQKVFLKKNKLDTRHWLFIIGTLILAFKHEKLYVLYIFIYIYCIAYSLKDTNFQKIKISNNKKIISTLKKLTTIICLTIFIITLPTSFINFKMVKSSSLEQAINYISNHYDKSNVKLYVDYNDGGYAEFYGFKPFIDERAEQFYKNINKKENIFAEWYNTIFITKEYEPFLEKYNFTHIITKNDSFYEYLLTNDNYQLITIYEYDSYHKEYNFYALFVKKDMQSF